MYREQSRKRLLVRQQAGELLVRGAVCNEMERRCGQQGTPTWHGCTACCACCACCAHAEPADAAGAASPAVSSLGGSPAVSLSSCASPDSSSGRRFWSATVAMEHMSGNSGQLFTAATAFCRVRVGVWGRRGSEGCIRDQGKTPSNQAYNTVCFPSKGGTLTPPTATKPAAPSQRPACLVGREHPAKGVAHKGHAHAVLLVHVGRQVGGRLVHLWPGRRTQWLIAAGKLRHAPNWPTHKSHRWERKPCLFQGSPCWPDALNHWPSKGVSGAP